MKSSKKFGSQTPIGKKNETWQTARKQDIQNWIVYWFFIIASPVCNIYRDNRYILHEKFDPALRPGDHWWDSMLWQNQLKCSRVRLQDMHMSLPLNKLKKIHICMQSKNKLRIKNLTMKNFLCWGFRYLIWMIYFGKTRFIYTVRTLLLESTTDS